ncbi:MAG: polysaccharide biosynthesis C-terminal domain-containing protein [Bryobacteraceae bacterium]
MYATAVAGVASLVLCAILIPRFGALGAAMALLTANIVHLLLPWWLFQRHAFPIPVPVEALRPMLAVLPSMAVFWFLMGAGPWIAVLAAALLYALFAVLSERNTLSRLFFHLKGAVAG